MQEVNISSVKRNFNQLQKEVYNACVSFMFQNSAILVDITSCMKIV